MKKIVVEKDLGEKETFDKWNGKFLDKTSYDTLVKVTDEDVGVMKPVNSLDGSDAVSYTHLTLPTNSSV